MSFSMTVPVEHDQISDNQNKPMNWTYIAPHYNLLNEHEVFMVVSNTEIFLFSVP